MRYKSIHNSLFLKNRQQFIATMAKNSIAIFVSNNEMPANGDAMMGFVQNSSFFYLTGIDQTDSYLILFSESSGNPAKEILFVKESNEHLIIWEGQKLTQSEASLISGIEKIQWSGTFWNMLDEILYDTEYVYCHVDKEQHKQKIDSNESKTISQIKTKYPWINVKTSSLQINSLREIKKDEEVHQIKTAINITKKGFERAAKFLKPGKYEFEVEAEISHEFMINRAQGHAFKPIMASGKNACILHYESNNDICNSDELLLMDFGANYGNYKADMTRVLPISGRFSSRQKDVYNAVLYVLKATIKEIKPGNNFNDLKQYAKNMIGEQLVALKLISANDCKTKPELINKYFPHGVSHNLGLDTHDVGIKNRVFEAGMVITCEPGIYIKEENIGIRLENDILITKNGNVDLMADIIVETEEIENLMNSK